MRGSNAKIAMLEQEMKARDDTIDTLETKMKDMKDMNDDTIDTVEKKMKDMNDTIDTLGKELTAKDATFGKELKTKDDIIDKLVREVSFLKDPPYTFFCAYQEFTYIISATITYSKLLYSSTSTMATMDIDTGIFTSGWGGTYTITWSLHTYEAAEASAVYIYLRKNGVSIT